MQEILNKANCYFEKGYWYSACCEFAQVFNEHPEEFSEKLTELFSSEQIAIIIEEVEKQAMKAKRVFSFGSEWNDDEILYVMGVRVTYELLYQYFLESEILFVSVEWEEIDSHFEHLENDENNKKSFRRALHSIYKFGPKIAFKVLNPATSS